MSAEAAYVEEFHKKFGVPIRSTPTVPPWGERLVREELIAEEFAELQDASGEGDIVGVADALADLMYVIYGGALVWGIPLDAVFREVHRSNMTKTPLPEGNDSESAVKPTKGDDYEEPRIAGVLALYEDVD